MVVTLLTDFGTHDEYVGVVKGVMLDINPKLTIVDLSHGISPQDVVEAGYLLRSAYGFFPENTVHLAVVDPGVGTDRHIIAARLDPYYFLAPDNGLLPLVWAQQVPETIVRVENKELFRQPVSRTFHGRDIFAPAAAHLSKGSGLLDLGRAVELDQLQRFDIKGVGLNSFNEIEGQVVSVDRFGNLITNISIEKVAQLAKGIPASDLVVKVGNCCIEGLSDTYDDGISQKLLALVGSRNCIEIALNGGSASEMLKVDRGAKVRIKHKSDVAMATHTMQK